MSEQVSFREFWNGLSGEDGPENSFQILDAEGCSHDSRVGAVCGWLGFCGCGDPESVLQMLHTMLRLRQAFHAHEMEYEQIVAQIDVICPGSASQYLAWYVLDDRKLAEHGGSVGGCWPTDDGKYFLEKLAPYIEATP